MMERNEPLLRKVGDWIANHPETYNQDAYLDLDPHVAMGRKSRVRMWLRGLYESNSMRRTISIVQEPLSCGATCCIAGTAVQLLPEFKGFTVEDDSNAIQFAVVGNSEVNVHSVAQEALGLSEDEGFYLFDGGFRPKGWTEDDEDLKNYDDPKAHAKLASLVKDALYRIADGAAVDDVGYISE